MISGTRHGSSTRISRSVKTSELLVEAAGASAGEATTSRLAPPLGKGLVGLGSVRHLVFDEADQMLSNESFDWQID